MRKIYLLVAVFFISGCSSGGLRQANDREVRSFLNSTYPMKININSGGEFLSFATVRGRSAKHQAEQCGVPSPREGKSYVEFEEEFSSRKISYTVFYDDKSQLANTKIYEVICPDERFESIKFGFWQGNYFGVMEKS